RHVFSTGSTKQFIRHITTLPALRRGARTCCSEISIERGPQSSSVYLSINRLSIQKSHLTEHSSTAMCKLGGAAALQRLCLALRPRGTSGVTHEERRRGSPRARSWLDP